MSTLGHKLKTEAMCSVQAVSAIQYSIDEIQVTQMKGRRII